MLSYSRPPTIIRGTRAVRRIREEWRKRAAEWVDSTVGRGA
jgi:hypothetical protein